jgi:hypothetical protein
MHGRLPSDGGVRCSVSDGGDVAGGVVVDRTFLQSTHSIAWPSERLRDRRELLDEVRDRTTRWP